MSDRHWIVISPELSGVIPVLDDGSGPREYWRESVSVIAPTERGAKVAAVWTMTEWPQYARHELGMTPFAGLEVRDAVCAHGFCWCDLEDCTVNDDLANEDYCETCMIEHA